jgi:hypothetical protein
MRVDGVWVKQCWPLTKSCRMVLFDFAEFQCLLGSRDNPACKERSAGFGVHGAMMHILPCKSYSDFLGRPMTVVYC